MSKAAARALVLLLVVMAPEGCQKLPSPMPRPGPVSEGSARWAFGVAQPLISAFALDATLYAILGGMVNRDGRLPTNIGDWSFVAWSPSQQKTLQVTVKYDGTASTTTRNEASPPSPIGRPIPAGWLDSPEIFAVAAPHLTCGVIHAQLAVLNVASYNEAPNQTVWAINFNVGRNQLVKWDGTYVGTQGSPDVPCATNLRSEFLGTAPCANQVIAGTPYNMDDPAWLVNVSDQNRNVCAYKFFAAFHMLGYDTQMGSRAGGKPHTSVLQKFQRDAGLPVGTLVTGDVLRKLDALLLLPGPNIAAVGRSFPLYDHTQPLHPHDISKDWLALIYGLPMSVLPPSLQMSASEMVQCINDQCNGFIQDANGNIWPSPLVDVTQDYRFVGAYFDPRRNNARLPSAAEHVNTVLHEYAHYLDGTFYQRSAIQPRLGSIRTWAFHDISFDMAALVQGCTVRRSNDPKDFITLYGFVSAYGCPPGRYVPWEEWAEAFSMYVAAGRHFRAAAAQNATIARKYNWLKTNVFQGVEYDTDLQRDVNSGCNDVPGRQQAQPAYASCREDYIWDAELRKK